MNCLLNDKEYPLRLAAGSTEPRRCRGCARRAFTLIEFVITMTISVIICGLAGSLLWAASQQRSEVSARGELIDMGSAAMERIVRYVREIEQNECIGSPTPCLYGNAQISTATAASIKFDVYGFQYNSGAGTLEMTTNSGANWYTLATDVSAVTLVYWNRTGSALTSFPLSSSDRAAVRRIQITLDLTRGMTSERVRSSVYLRNFINEVASDP